MRVECTSSHTLITAEVDRVLTSCWPDFLVTDDQIEQLDDEGALWRAPVPPAMAARIRAGDQTSKWQNSATVRVGDDLATVVLTFDPGTAVED